MKRILTLITLIVTIAFFLTASCISAEDISSSNHEIVITTTDEKIEVIETITLHGDSDEYINTVSFWILNGASSVNIVVKGSKVLYNETGNVYTTNLSDMAIEMNSQPNIEITYNLNKDTENFQKELLHNTTSVKVTFDGNTLYSGNNLISRTSFTLSLYKPTEAPLSTYLIIGIVLLIILLVIVTMFALRKQKTTKIKKIAAESEELLTTKKALLMTLLKDIEKQHRAKQISDDTYHKLKERYKQEAVEAMKQLEDMKSNS
jgi:hypothetical protein